MLGLGTALLPDSSSAASAQGKKQIVFVHGKASHGYGGHAYGPAFRMLARMFNENIPAVSAVVPANGVPSARPTLEQLETDLGMPRPANFKADAIRQ